MPLLYSKFQLTKLSYLSTSNRSEFPFSSTKVLFSYTNIFNIYIDLALSTPVSIKLTSLLIPSWQNGIIFAILYLISDIYGRYCYHQIFWPKRTPFYDQSGSPLFVFLFAGEGSPRQMRIYGPWPHRADIYVWSDWQRENLTRPPTAREAQPGRALQRKTAHLPKLEE
jgi:hypothetical protein